ncbi:MAG: hypothetical protein K0R22_2931, partial [Sporomusa sp.]|nr:hypothetical protein [Sporomusa sp.]
RQLLLYFVNKKYGFMELIVVKDLGKWGELRGYKTIGIFY